MSRCATRRCDVAMLSRGVATCFIERCIRALCPPSLCARRTLSVTLWGRFFCTVSAQLRREGDGPCIGNVTGAGGADDSLHWGRGEPPHPPQSHCLDTNPGFPRNPVWLHCPSSPDSEQFILPVGRQSPLRPRGWMPDEAAPDVPDPRSVPLQHRHPQWHAPRDSPPRVALRHRAMGNPFLARCRSQRVCPDASSRAPRMNACPSWGGLGHGQFAELPEFNRNVAFGCVATRLRGQGPCLTNATCCARTFWNCRTWRFLFLVASGGAPCAVPALCEKSAVFHRRQPRVPGS